MCTGVQLQGVLDELLFYEGPLGATASGQGVQVTLWAPTAQQVLFPAGHMSRILL